MAVAERLKQALDRRPTRGYALDADSDDVGVEEPPSATGQYPDPVWRNGSATQAQGVFSRAAGDGDSDDSDVPDAPSATGQYPGPVWADDSAVPAVTSAAQAAEPAPSSPAVPLKDADYSETCRPNDPEQPAAPAPTATLDHAAMYKIIRETAIPHSGDAAYTAISPDAEFAQGGQAAGQARHFGLGFGLLLFTQESGHLGSVLKLMQQRDPAAFADTFGPQSDSLLKVTTADTPEARLQPVENAPLWADVWTARFRKAGANPTFQAAQNEEAIEQVFRPMLNVTFPLGIISDRGLAMALDRVLTRGPGGGLDWIVQACGPLRTFEQRNYALDLLGFDGVREFQEAAGWTPQDGSFGPETHAALVGALREQGLVPLPTPADYEARMIATATGAVRTRLLRLRDSTVLNDTIFRL